MSVRNFDQRVSDQIVTRLRALGNPNTTFLINDQINARKTTRQNAVADELALDAQITSRKQTTVPANFTTADRCIIVYDSKPELQARGILDRLRFNADVKYIVSFGLGLLSDDLENFVMIHDDLVEFFPADRSQSAQTQLRIFERRKVDVA